MQATVPSLPPSVEAALTEATAELRRLYGNRFVRAVLFGSYARGEAKPPEADDASDVDVLVVLRDLARPAAEVSPLASLSMDLMLRHGAVFNFFPMAEKRAANPTHSLMMNVNREGVEL